MDAQASHSLVTGGHSPQESGSDTGRAVRWGRWSKDNSRKGRLRSLQHVEYQPVDLDGDEPTAHVNCQTVVVWRRTVQSLCIAMSALAFAFELMPCLQLPRTQCGAVSACDALH